MINSYRFSSTDYFNYALRSNSTNLNSEIYITDPETGALKMNRDASVIIVADYTVNAEAGKAAVLDWNGTTWVQRGSAFLGGEPGDRLGGFAERSNSIAIDGLGQTVIIGSPNHDVGAISQAGKVAVYEYSGIPSLGWIQKGDTFFGTTSPMTLGSHVDISFDGNTVLISESQFTFSSNNAYPKVYEWSGSAWVQKGSSIPVDMQGSAQSKAKLSPDGNIVVVSNSLADEPGKSNMGLAEIYEWSGIDWVQKGSTLPLDNSTHPTESRYTILGTNEDATRVVASYRTSSGWPGWVEVYNWNGSDWSLTQTMSGEDNDDRLGDEGAMTRDGQWLIMTAIGAGPTDGGMLYFYKYDFDAEEFVLNKSHNYIDKNINTTMGRDDATLTYDENILRLQYLAEHPMFDITLD